MAQLLSSVDPWMEKEVFDAIVNGKQPPPTASKFVQVLLQGSSRSTSSNPDGTSWIVSDTEACMTMVASANNSISSLIINSGNNSSKQVGSLFKIESYRFIQLKPNNEIGLETSSIKLVGAAGMGQVGNPIDIGQTVQVQRALNHVSPDEVRKRLNHSNTDNNGETSSGTAVESKKTSRLGRPLELLKAGNGRSQLDRLLGRSSSTTADAPVAEKKAPSTTSLGSVMSLFRNRPKLNQLIQSVKISSPTDGTGDKKRPPEEETAAQDDDDDDDDEEEDRPCTQLQMGDDEYILPLKEDVPRQRSNSAPYDLDVIPPDVSTEEVPHILAAVAQETDEEDDEEEPIGISDMLLPPTQQQQQQQQPNLPSKKRSLKIVAPSQEETTDDDDDDDGHHKSNKRRIDFLTSVSTPRRAVVGIADAAADASRNYDNNPSCNSQRIVDKRRYQESCQFFHQLTTTATKEEKQQHPTTADGTALVGVAGSSLTERCQSSQSFFNSIWKQRHLQVIQFGGKDIT